jgi:excinuclease ABC subunit C
MKEQTETRRKLHATALDAPKTSGVYMWKDEKGTVIYVGKAKSLKNRLSSYFTSNRDIKTRILVSRAQTIEYITTDNEYEALLLENTLIKKFSPRYNINLKDGKTYPVIKITNEKFPRIYRTRRIQNDGGHYFGPFPNVNAIDDFLEFIKRNYRVRQCKILRKRTTPCLYYHIGRCSAPCCGKISAEDYHRDLEEIFLLLDGDTATSIARLETLMKDAAKALLFEKAARIRDGIAAIRELREQNAVVDMDAESRDYIAWAAEGTMVTFAVLQMRGGRLTGRDLYRVRSLKDEEEILPEFLMAYYSDATTVPPRIFVPTSGGLALAGEWFRSGLKCATEIAVIDPDGAVPAEKRHTAAMAMARFNAKQDAARRLREHGDFPALEELKSVLGLPTVPSAIEGFDIAHIGGRLPVASLITFRDGNPDRKNYRMFRLRTTDGIIDDFASMREVTARRYTRLINEKADLPDLILIDGGIGQVNAVKGVLDALGADVPVIGLAKQDEEIYLPGNSTPLSLPKRSDALRLLQRVRDETHRFATTRNQRLRTKENTTLIFEELPGVGPKKAVKLLERYGTLESLAAAAAKEGGVAEIATAAGISAKVAGELAAALPGLIEKRKQEREKRAASGTTGFGGEAGTGADESLDLEALAAQALDADENENIAKGGLAGDGLVGDQADGLVAEPPADYTEKPDTRAE